MNYKDLLKKYPIKGALIQYGIILAFIILMRPRNFIEFGGIIATVSMIIGIFIKYKNNERLVDLKTIKSFFRTFVVSSLFYLFWIYVGAYSIVIAIIMIAAYKMYRQRKLVLDTIKFGSNALGDIFDKTRNDKSDKGNSTTGQDCK